MNTPLSQSPVNESRDDHLCSYPCTQQQENRNSTPQDADAAASTFLRPLTELNYRELAQLHQLFERSEIITCHTCDPSVRDLPEKTLLACLSTLCQYDAVDSRALKHYLSGPNAFVRGCNLLEARARQLLTFEKNATSSQTRGPHSLCGCANA